MQEEKKVFDVAVIGGGPAGIMAAGKAAESGASVILLEKNKSLGKKLFLTGSGRCNITNAEFNIKKLVSSYGKNGKFLFHAFSVFGPREVLSFFDNQRLKTKTERGKRVFPVSDKSRSVIKALTDYLKNSDVTLILNAEVHRLSLKGEEVKKIMLKGGGEIYARNHIIATGGVSYSFTGSSGDGIRWASKTGHKIAELSPALVPLEAKEEWVKSLQGLDLKNIRISVKEGERKKEEIVGECIFTHFGIGGPAILKLSKTVGEIKKRKKDAKLSLDLKPGLSREKLDKRIQRDFGKYANKLFKNSLQDLLPSKIIPVIISLSQIDAEKEVNKVTREERKRLVKLLKDLEISVAGTMGFNMAVVTSGGVSLSEIDDKSMKSKRVKNLFFAGEVIDVDGTTGGFNLQMCWSTGYLAGKSAIKTWKD